MVDAGKRVYQLHNGALGDGVLVVASFQGQEQLSTPFRFEVELVANKADLDGEAILAADAWLGIKQPTMLAGSGRRGVQMLRIHGVLAGFEQHGKGEDGVRYRAVLVPRLWRLSLTSQSRIFQDLSTVDIVKQVLQEHGFEPDDAEWRATGRTYPAREYVVQYQESDLAFISRLLEYEGIFYFFEHHDQRSTVVFGDHPEACQKLAGNSTFYCRSHAGTTRQGTGGSVEESVSDIVLRHQPLTAEVALADFNYRTPGAALAPSATVSSPAAFGVQYDYGDHFKDADQGKAIADVRAEEIASRKRRYQGLGDARGFRAGGVFALREHYRADINGDHLLIAVRHQGSQGFTTSDEDEHPTAKYANDFTSMPASVVFRPPRLTPKPVVAGMLTARIDAAGDGKYAELDDHGRYKVKFPFDRSDLKDGKASRFVRMAQPYGGDGMGMHFPLHKGTEVLITHINGDPDRPLIAAAVPNPSTASMVVAGNQTQSVIRTGGKNAMVLEDTEGAEEFNLNATRDHHFAIGNDSEVKVVNNARKSVGVDNSVSIGANDAQKVGKDRSVDIGANSTSSVKLNQNVVVGINSSESIGAAKELSIGAAYQVTVGGLMNETVGGAKTEEVGGYRYETVKGERKLDVGKAFTVTVKESHQEEAKDKRHIKAKAILVEAAEEIVLSCGKASITLRKDGTIQLDGKDILFQASAKIAGKAAGEIKFKGSKIGGN